jgi:hypothetical protein
VKVRELLAKINDAVRPVHVEGSIPPMDAAERRVTQFSPHHVHDEQEERPK